MDVALGLAPHTGWAITALRSELGAPWAADHRKATAAALVALHSV